ncbi:hypothetical protein BJ508DRAFT_335517 [Ascobolus immersus RN42]|uniref:Uncharacterized protein n=1 Tax=Ascobolus immersus RN42 TaxID=1160509 RepID=A0A3N4HEB9_ASCIM|nr:hypothetical protein BJ508DRAFT_335517 [Ascobolus immersus RN42]
MKPPDSMALNEGNSCFQSEYGQESIFGQESPSHASSHASSHTLSYTSSYDAALANGLVHGSPFTYAPYNAAVNDPGHGFGHGFGPVQSVPHMHGFSQASAYSTGHSLIHAPAHAPAHHTSAPVYTPGAGPVPVPQVQTRNVPAAFNRAIPARLRLDYIIPMALQSSGWPGSRHRERLLAELEIARAEVEAEEAAMVDAALIDPQLLAMNPAQDLALADAAVPIPALIDPMLLALNPAQDLARWQEPVGEAVVNDEEKNDGAEVPDTDFEDRRSLSAGNDEEGDEVEPSHAVSEDEDEEKPEPSKKGARKGANPSKGVNPSKKGARKGVDPSKKGLIKDGKEEKGGKVFGYESCISPTDNDLMDVLLSQGVDLGGCLPRWNNPTVSEAAKHFLAKYKEPLANAYYPLISGSRQRVEGEHKGYKIQTAKVVYLDKVPGCDYSRSVYDLENTGGLKEARAFYVKFTGDEVLVLEAAAKAYKADNNSVPYGATNWRTVSETHLSEAQKEAYRQGGRYAELDRELQNTMGELYSKASEGELLTEEGVAVLEYGRAVRKAIAVCSYNEKAQHAEFILQMKEGLPEAVEKKKQPILNITRKKGKATALMALPDEDVLAKVLDENMREAIPGPPLASRRAAQSRSRNGRVEKSRKPVSRRSSKASMTEAVARSTTGISMSKPSSPQGPSSPYTLGPSSYTFGSLGDSSHSAGSSSSSLSTSSSSTYGFPSYASSSSSLSSAGAPDGHYTGNSHHRTATPPPPHPAHPGQWMSHGAQGYFQDAGVGRWAHSSRARAAIAGESKTAPSHAVPGHAAPQSAKHFHPYSNPNPPRYSYDDRRGPETGLHPFSPLPSIQNHPSGPMRVKNTLLFPSPPADPQQWLSLAGAVPSKAPRG